MAAPLLPGLQFLVALEGAVQFRHGLAVLDHGSPESRDLHLEGAQQKLGDFHVAVYARLGVGGDDLVAQSALIGHAVPFVFRASGANRCPKRPFQPRAATAHYMRIMAWGKRKPRLREYWELPD